MYYMKKIFILLIINELIFPSFSFAQVKFESAIKEYNSAILDFTTNENLPFASVYVNGGASTLSNELGQFCVTGDTADIIKISYIGYEKVSFRLKDMPKTIKLKPYTVKLGEVTVIPLNKVINNIMKSSFAEVNKYEKYESNFFYRQITATSGCTNEFIEAFFEGKSAFAMRDVRLVNGRFACLRSDDEHFYSNVNNYWDYSCVSPVSKKIVKGCVILPFTPQYKKYYKADYCIISGADGETLYKITMTPKNNVKTAIVKGTIWIDPDEMRLMRFSGSILNATVQRKGIKIPFYTSFDCTYSHDKGFTEISSVKMLSTYKFQDHDVAVNSIMFNIGNRELKGKKKLKDRIDLKDKISSVKYDSKYWNENNVIKYTPMEIDVIKTFEKDGLFCNYKK